MKLHNLLLTTDFSDLARRAYPAAASLAKAEGARLHLVHVAEPLPPHYYLSLEGAATDVPKGTYYDGIKERLEEERKAHEVFDGLEVVTQILLDALPHDAIDRYAQANEIDLIVTSTHGHTGLGRALLGSFTEKIVRTTHAPVLTYRPRKGVDVPASPETVLVPFDFSGNASRALPAVRWLAEKFSPKFTFLHVVEPEYLVPDRFSTEAWYEILRTAAEEARTRAAARFRDLRDRELSGIDAEFEIAEGVPHEEIIRAAEKMDLVVMATHGWTGLKHFLLGSVAEKVVRKASCSVLTVRPEEMRRETEEAKEGKTPVAKS